jgi:cytochrome c-type biogenesis protein CcmH/NrfG
MKSYIRSLLAVFLFASGAAMAAAEGPPGGSATPADPVLERAGGAIERKDWAAATAALREGLGQDPRKAEYHNLYAYALRNSPNPSMDLVFRHYNEALRIEPNHRGAHEYLGEAYLMVGNLAKAKEHLGVLDRLCTFGCDEYTMLKKAVAQFEAKKK